MTAIAKQQEQNKKYSDKVPYSGFGNSSQNKLSSDMWGQGQPKHDKAKLTNENFERLQKKALPQDYMGERESNYQFY